MNHTRDEVLALLKDGQVVVVATQSGDSTRTRMMHFAIDDDFRIYVASMKGDPKTIQMANRPAVSLLAYFPAPDFNQSKEIEITGSPIIVSDPREREKALELTAGKSPVVKQLTQTGNAGLLECIRIEPWVVKLRVFGEIVQGMPPTVIEFPETAHAVSEWKLLGQKMKHWYQVVRAPFLTASGAPVLLGTAIAFATGAGVSWGYFFLTLLAGLLIHVGANVINDYFDHKSTNDDINREFVRPFSGGSRLIQLGLLSPTEVLGIALLAFAISSGIGIYLAATRGPLILVLGVVGVVSSFFYTGRPFYWAKRGLGELLVGLNFGPLMTLGAFYVQAQTFSWLPVMAAIPLGLFIAAVLYINEFPDYVADKAVEKNTLVVRFGRGRAVPLYIVITVLGNLLIIAGIVARILPLPALLALAAAPLTIRAIQQAVLHYDHPFELAPANALTIISHMAIGLGLSLAFVWLGVTDGWTWVVAFLGLAFLVFIGKMYLGVEQQKKAMSQMKSALSSPQQG